MQALQDALEVLFRQKRLREQEACNVWILCTCLCRRTNNTDFLDTLSSLYTQYPTTAVHPWIRQWCHSKISKTVTFEDDKEVDDDDVFERIPEDVFDTVRETRQMENLTATCFEAYCRHRVQKHSLKAWARHCMQILQCGFARDLKVYKTIRRRDEHLLYFLTHVIFFGSVWGTRPLSKKFKKHTNTLWNWCKESLEFLKPYQENHLELCLELACCLKLLRPSCRVEKFHTLPVSFQGQNHRSKAHILYHTLWLQLFLKSLS